MKRSNLITITLVLMTIETAYTLARLNEMYQFMNGVLQTKYYVLFILSYMGFVSFSCWYGISSVPSLEFKRTLRQYFEEVYGRERYSFFYTFHFLVFAGAAFYINAWGYFGMSLSLWILWTWVRSLQNDYADEYELDRKKEEAKHKPTIVLNEK